MFKYSNVQMFIHWNLSEVKLEREAEGGVLFSEKPSAAVVVIVKMFETYMRARLSATNFEKLQRSACGCVYVAFIY